MYFTVIDTAIQSLQSRFDQNSFRSVKELEEYLLSVKVADVVKSYPEVDVACLAFLQLSMFHSSITYNNVDQAVAATQASSQEIKQLFCVVEKLLRLLLVLPVSSCEAESAVSVPYDD